MEDIIHRDRFCVAGQNYEICVYCRPDGRHYATTVFRPGDVIISDGLSLDEVLQKHQRLLPLAVDSRLILSELRHCS